MSHSKKANNLIHSSSPYLKQHAYNPVNWYPWGPASLQKAKDEDKPMIISIGYSACHWCHVMEHESFENEEIAKVMNDGFVCIKVDREERPDVDQIYMEAIQTMGINGGWPLNVFALPDQKPFYGGTYFRPKQWLHILNSIIAAYREKRNQLEESANEFTKAISISDSEKYGMENLGMSASQEDLRQMMLPMKNHFDRKEGGLNRAPKFPNPSIWKFLLVGNAVINDNDIHDHVMLTLQKMAHGGIYDHIGGGFARYSVDERWFAPHFEKMLYDNGQLISLYSLAYQVDKQERYKELVFESIEFVRRELMNTECGFFAALDADSEGEEGNYYIWSENELKELLGDDAAMIMEYYHTSHQGNWERGLNILHTKTSRLNFAEQRGLKVEDFDQKLSRAKSILLVEREKRERPGLDDKILSGWNAMMLKGLVDAYHAFGDKSFIELAENNAQFIHDNLMVEEALLRSFPKGGELIPAYLDDYAFVIDALLALYQCNFNEDWLLISKRLTDYVIRNFYDPSEELFFYTDSKSEMLIARKKEMFDNVIPASNSVMAQNLYMLGTLMENESYIDISKAMIAKVASMIKAEPQYLTNWGTLFSFYTYPTIEIAIVGDNYIEFAHEIQKHFFPNKVIDGCRESSDRPLLKHRLAIDGLNTIYVCFHKSCKLPVHTVDEALAQIKESFFHRKS